MNEKRNAWLTVGIIIGIILIFTVADLVNSDRVFSEKENRVLAKEPEFAWEELLYGNYTEDYETYVSDQFVVRDKWVGMKTRADILLRKKEINGVYLGKSKYLIEKHSPGEYTDTLINERLEMLKPLVEQWNAKVMLVPTADNVLTEKLPDYAVYFDQREFLDKVENIVGEENVIDVYSILREHADENIYYRTDHHWTSLGAYYGFQAWRKALDKFDYPYDVENMQTVTENFLGTLHSAVNISVQPDSIKYFPQTELGKISVTYDFVKTADSLYEPKYLDTKNAYGFFLDDNHAFTKISTMYGRGKTLLVIKDSYANSMLPLLTKYYETIYVVDLRYYNGELFPLMEQCETETGMDVLVLYNCIHFLEDFRYN